MKLKMKIAAEILLVVAALLIFIYNFSNRRETAYMASAVAVVGTAVNLIRDILKLNRY